MKSAATKCLPTNPANLICSIQYEGVSILSKRHLLQPFALQNGVANNLELLLLFLVVVLECDTNGVCISSYSFSLNFLAPFWWLRL